MGMEIERKFLVADDSWRAAARDAVPMRQGYLACNSECSVRIRVAGDRAACNVKGATLGVARPEFEFPLPVADARDMLDLFCRGRCLDKVRHLVPYGAHVWEVDVFSGANAGLVVAEIELGALDEPFERPPWLGAEVSEDHRYYNVCLIDHPYSAWGNDLGVT